METLKSITPNEARTAPQEGAWANAYLNEKNTITALLVAGAITESEAVNRTIAMVNSALPRRIDLDDEPIDLPLPANLSNSARTKIWQAYHDGGWSTTIAGDRIKLTETLPVPLQTRSPLAPGLLHG